MASTGAAYFTSAYSSYSGCRQYRENILAAQQTVGPAAPQVDKLRVFFNHPGFIEPMVEAVQAAFARLPPERRAAARLVYTAHSIPLSMAEGCRYEVQLAESCGWFLSALGEPTGTLLIKAVAARRRSPGWCPTSAIICASYGLTRRRRDVVVVPIGFLSDHVEVLFDLDTEAQQISGAMGLEHDRRHRGASSQVRADDPRLDHRTHRAALTSAAALGELVPATTCARSTAAWRRSARPSPVAVELGIRV